MGYFKDLEIEVIDLYRHDGLKDAEIAKITGLSLTEVNEILASYEYLAMDYDESDTDMVSYDDLTFDPGAEHY